ncbi:LacI family DNA-binding transcriptional regulator, partial [Klebsiella pneumoniae]
MAVTIRDVAHAAGVSPMSVSKVLHDRGTNVRVGSSTAAKIRAAA